MGAWRRSSRPRRSLVEEGQVGTETGEDDDLLDRVQAAAVLGDQDQSLSFALDCVRAEAGDGIRVALFNGGLGGEAERAAGGELIGGPATEGRAGDTPAQDPGGVCASAVLGLGEVGEGGERGEGGGAGADDGGALARVTGPNLRVLEVGDTVRDAVGRRALAEGREPVAAAWGWGRPRCRRRR